MADIFKKFEDVTALHTYLKTNKTTDVFYGCEHSKDGGEGFTGTESWEEAERLFSCGDRKIAKSLEQRGLSRERIKTKLTANRRRLYANVCGFAPHVPNYLAGVPAAMLNVHEVRVKEKVINVVYNISASGSQRKEDLLRAGVEMFTAVMKIEAGGVRVNLYVADISDGRDGQKVGWLCRIKNSSQHLDVLKMCYPLCNPSMLRRHSFRFTEVTKGVHSCFTSGYGRASSDIRKMLKTFQMKDVRCLSFNSVRGKAADELAKNILKGECD